MRLKSVDEMRVIEEQKGYPDYYCNLNDLIRKLGCDVENEEDLYLI